MLLLRLIYLSLSQSLARAARSAALLGKAVIPGTHLGKPMEKCSISRRFYGVKILGDAAIEYPMVWGKQGWAQYYNAHI